MPARNRHSHHRRVCSSTSRAEASRTDDGDPRWQYRLRRSELVALAWTNIDLEPMQVNVRRSCVRSRFGDTLPPFTRHEPWCSRGGPKDAQELLRHVTSRTTLEVYTRAISATKRQANDRVLGIEPASSVDPDQAAMLDPLPKFTCRSTIAEQHYRGSGTRLQMMSSLFLRSYWESTLLAAFL